MAQDDFAVARASLGAREIVGLVAVNSPAFVEAAFAAQSAGQISVPLRSADDLSRIETAGVSRIVTPSPGSGWGRMSYAPPADDAVAQILFTSGTTGEAKGIALTNANIADTTERLNAVMGLDASVREYVGVPVYYSFGIGRCRAVSAAGGAWYVPPRGFDPVEIAGMLKAGEINAISAVPTLWRLVLAAPDSIAPHAGAVKWIEIGSQSMSRAEKEGLKALFPNAVIVQHYGLTEASRATFLRIDVESGERLETVGSATGAAEVRISADGRVMLRGPHVAQRMLSDAGLRPLTDADGWLMTEDLGELRDGRLVFRGRADDLINCGGVKIMPETLEARIAAVLGSSEGLAVARLPDAVRGDAILVAFTPAAGRDSASVQRAAVAAAEQFGLHAAGAVKTLAVDALPVTETGKLRRTALAEAYARDAAPDGMTERLVGLWRETLGAGHVGPDDTFFALGGDEHGAGLLVARMEAAGVAPDIARRLFDGLSVGEIARLTEAAPHPAATSPTGAGVQEQLLAIWREALGRDDVSVDHSFYDVGGDSLSAVAVALGMEKAGFAPEVAHGIFDGLTIAQIAHRTQADAAPENIDLEARLLAIWREALGRDDVTVDQGFYDIGGDSLSAVTVALGMERAGFAPEVAHGIFDGKSIRALCEDLAPAAGGGDARAQPRVRTRSEIAILGEASNFVKGVVLLCMVASHWVPIYLLALGLRFGLVGQALAPIFSLGSPTLAFSFGLGVALFHRRQLEVSPPAFRRNVRTGSLLLGGGLLVGAAQEVLSHGVVDGVVTGAIVTTALTGGPFVFYGLATLSLPLWLGRLRPGMGAAKSMFMIAAAIYAAYLGAQALMPATQDGSLYAALREVLVGHWSLFQMSAIVALGVGVGLALGAHLQAGGRLRDYRGYGLLMMTGGLLASAAAGDLTNWITFPKPINPWSILFYAGLALTAIALFETATAAVAANRPLRRLIEWICCGGVLLFPLYVGQSLVFHGSKILGHYSGLSPVKALTVVIAVFLALAANPLWRVYKLYYAGRK